MALTETPRASPDALLTLANREGRGRLKIFLGAAPGVGKTYAMLQAARTALEGDVDVVIGLVETHGRQETEDLSARLRDPAPPVRSLPGPDGAGVRSRRCPETPPTAHPG